MELQALLGCELGGVWSGGGGHLLHHLLLLHEHVLDLLHLSVQLIEVDLELLNTRMSNTILPIGMITDRVLTCSPAFSPSPATMVLVTLLSISGENKTVIIYVLLIIQLKAISCSLIGSLH